MNYFIFENKKIGSFVIKEDIVAWSWKTYKVYRVDEILENPDLVDLWSEIYFSEGDIVFNSTDIKHTIATGLAVLGECCKILDRTMPRAFIIKDFDFKILDVDEDGFELWKELNLK